MVGCAVSGASTITTSASATASATVFTVSPASSAFFQLFDPSRSPTRTSTPLSFRFSECACPCDPYPTTATFFSVMSFRSASLSYRISAIVRSPGLRPP